MWAVTFLVWAIIAAMWAVIAAWALKDVFGPMLCGKTLKIGLLLQASCELLRGTKAWN